MRGKERVRASVFAVVSGFNNARRASFSHRSPFVALYLVEIQQGPIRDCAELLRTRNFVLTGIGKSRYARRAARNSAE